MAPDPRTHLPHAILPAKSENRSHPDGILVFVSSPKRTSPISNRPGDFAFAGLLLSCRHRFPLLTASPATQADHGLKYKTISEERRVNVVAGKGTSHHARTPQRRSPSAKKSRSTLDRVREGVRRFILNQVSIGEFHRAIRTAIKKGELSPNPLTGVRFRKIVKEVVDERKREARHRGND
jgi:hypothetical protein